MMSAWQKIIVSHGNRVEAIDLDTIKVFGSSWNPTTKEVFDAVITKTKQGYTVKESDGKIYKYKSIYEWLGY